MIITKRSIKLKFRLIFGPLDVGNRVRKGYLFSIISVLCLENKHLLDAGCGNGAFAFYIARRYPECKITGIDYDKDRIRQAEADKKVLGIDNIDFFQWDLTKPFGEREYDLIYCIDVLEHITNDEIVLSNFLNALKPEGNLVIHVPLVKQKRILDYFKNWKQSNHVRDGYDDQSLINMLKRQGFVLIERKYTFGWAGAFAWEIHEVCRYLGKVARIGIFPVLALLATLDLRLRKQKGNAILIVAMRESNHAD